MIILCSGIYRSCSTWAYNVAKIMAEILCELHQKDGVIGYGDGDALNKLFRDNQDKIGLFKTHNPSYEATMAVVHGMAKNIYTYRDPAHIVASRQKFTDETLEESIKLVKDCSQYGEVFLKDPNSLVMSFEQITGNSCLQIERMALYLGLELSGNDIREIDGLTGLKAVGKIVGKIDGTTVESFSGHAIDASTQYHQNHITGSKFEDLPKLDKTKILEAKSGI